MTWDCEFTIRARGEGYCVEELLGRLDGTSRRMRLARCRVTDTLELPAPPEQRLLEISGRCSGSLRASTREGDPTLARDGLAKVADELDLDLEAYALNPTRGHAEHYRYGPDGSVVAREARRVTEWFWDEDRWPSFADFAHDNPSCPFSEDDFEMSSSLFEGDFGREFSDELRPDGRRADENLPVPDARAS